MGAWRPRSFTRLRPKPRSATPTVRLFGGDSSEASDRSGAEGEGRGTPGGPRCGACHSRRQQPRRREGDPGVKGRPRRAPGRGAARARATGREAPAGRTRHGGEGGRRGARRGPREGEAYTELDIRASRPLRRLGAGPRRASATSATERKRDRERATTTKSTVCAGPPGQEARGGEGKSGLGRGPRRPSSPPSPPPERRPDRAPVAAINHPPDETGAPPSLDTAANGVKLCFA